MKQYSRYFFSFLYEVLQVAKKEARLFFLAPLGYIFLLLFGLTNLFILFWVEGFFIRNIANIQVIFEWMPLVLIFFAAPLTMRMWSEERSKHTIHLLLSVPQSLLSIVLGKLLACVFILLVGLLTLLLLPFSLHFVLGVQLDWGVIFGSYLATLFLGVAYFSLGLFVSCLSKNQIVSLLLTTVFLLFLYLVGQTFIHDFLDIKWLDGVLSFISPVTHFTSITRGIISVLDLYYYVFFMSVFVVLNVLFLYRLKYSGKRSHISQYLLAFLVVFNFLIPNFFMDRLVSGRFDLTQQSLFSLAPITKAEIEDLPQPMRIYAFLSQKTHPLITPLLSQVSNLLKEYEALSSGGIELKIIDPAEDPALAKQVKEDYSIEPNPFQISKRYESSIINAYFNVVIEYGDDFKSLNFSNLIRVDSSQPDNMSVSLRNPEYQITKIIRALKSEFGTQGNLIEFASQPIALDVYFSQATQLPKTVQAFEEKALQWLETTKEKHPQKFSYTVHRAENQQQIEALTKKGVQPFAAGLFERPFYFNFILNYKGISREIPFPSELTQAHLEDRFKKTLKSLVSSNLPKISLYANSSDEDGKILYAFLKAKFDTRINGLSYGSLLNESDVLILYRPENLTNEQVLSIDQFVMQGGRLIVLGGNNKVVLDKSGGTQKTIQTGLEDWFKFYGIEWDKRFVKDTSNISMAMLLKNPINGLPEYKVQKYPYFVNLKDDMLAKHPINSGVQNMIFPWASIIHSQQPTAESYTVKPLVAPSKNAWLVDSSLALYPKAAGNTSFYQPTDQKAEGSLAVLVEGEIPSYFSINALPVLENNIFFPTVHKQSVLPAKMVLVNSGNMLDPALLNILGSMRLSQYVESHFNWLVGMVNYFSEDEDFLSIQNKNYHPNAMPLLEKKQQTLLEYSSYIFVLFALLILYGLNWFYDRKRFKKQLERINSHFSHD